MIFPRPLLRRLVLATAVMWLLIRILTIVVVWVYIRIAGIVTVVDTFSRPAMIIVVLLVLLLFWVDMRAFRERVLFANLGLSPLKVSSIVLSCALALELVATVSIGPLIGDLVSQ